MFNEAVFFVVLDDSAETPGRCRGRGGDDRGDGGGHGSGGRSGYCCSGSGGGG